MAGMTILGNSYDFDFGNSPTIPGFTKVTPQTLYSPEAGFGWDQPLGVWNPSWGEWGPDALREDYLFSARNRTFRLDLPDASYRLALIMTHPRGDRGPVTVRAAGKTLISNRELAAADYEPRIFTVEVTGGKLEIEFLSRNRLWLINGLSVDKVKKSEKRCSDEIIMGAWETVSDKPGKEKRLPGKDGVVNLLALGEDRENYTVQARLEIEKGFRQATLLFRYRNANTYYALAIQKAETGLNPLPPPGGSSYIRLLKNENGQSTVLFHLPFEPVPGRTYKLRAECVDSLIKCHIDDKLIFETIDHSLKTGRIALRNSGGHCVFRDVEQKSVTVPSVYFQADLTARLAELRGTALRLDTFLKTANPELGNNIKSDVQILHRKLKEISPAGATNFSSWKTLFEKLQSGLENVLPAAAYLESLNAMGIRLDKDYAAGIENSLTKVFRRAESFHGEITDRVRLELCRNEYESFQLVLMPLRNLNAVSIEAGDLISRKGSRINKKFIKWSPVCYIPNPPEKEFRREGGWPDALPEVRHFNAEFGKLQPVWITLYVPEGVQAGEYQGELTVKIANAAPLRLHIDVTVWDFTLPRSSFLKTAFGLWDNFLSKYHNLPENTPAFAALRRKYTDNMLAHRISFRNTGINYRLKADGVPTADFSDFDQKLKADLEKGRNCFFYGLNFGAAGKVGTPEVLKMNVYDEAAGKMVSYPFGPAFSEKFNRTVTAVFRNWVKHLKAGGWFKPAYNYTCDEPGRESYEFIRKVTDLIHSVDKEIKTVVPMTDFSDDPANVPEGIDVWVYHAHCNDINDSIRREIDKRRGQGKEMWWYVSWEHFLTTQELLAHRAYFWKMWKYNITGLLYWTINSWTADPWKNLHRWAPPYKARQRLDFGNAFLVYPGETGPVNTIRWELLRDGIEDYDYFALLKEKLAVLKQADNKNNAALIESAEKVLRLAESLVKNTNTFTGDARKIYDIRRKIAEKIIAVQQQNKN